MSAKKFRLLPPDKYLGWIPYVWLIYLPSLLIDPIVQTRAGIAPWWTWPVTIAGVLIFLVSYFRAYWLTGRARLRMAAFQTALAIAFSPFNTGASVLFVYAASFAGQAEQVRVAARSVILIAVIATVVAWLTRAPLYYYVTGTFVTLLIGGINLHYARYNRSQQKLKLAQQEVEHLATVAERERIGRDLHDVLGHTLSVIVLKSELAAKLIDRDPERAGREIREVEEVSRKALQEVREAIRGYRATLADEVERARAVLKAAAIETEFDVQTIPLDRNSEESLAMALRESITNVIRHSEAARCTVRLHRNGSGIVLEVIDDGRGGKQPEGAGLRGMRERIAILGGSVDRDTAKGTRLTVRIPAAT